MIRVIVIDDHAVVRECLKRVLGESLEMSVVAEAGGGNEGLRLVRSVPCDVVILDIALPQKSGLDVLKEIHAEKPQLPVLVLSAYSEDQYAIRCLQAGAAGYLNKETVMTEVIQAVRKVFPGGRYVTPHIAEKILLSLSSHARPAYQNLSDREYQVVCLIASGKTVSEIAEELALSVKTITTYRARVLEKLNVRNNSEIIRYAIKQGLVD